MLIDFTIRNFMSYRNEVSFSMVASSTVKECESSAGYSNVSVTNKDKRILRSAAIYGANGSGKSSVIAAMDIFKSMVLQSCVDENTVKNLSGLYYRFDVECINEPISMQMVFMCNGERYRYGFEVKHGIVLTEWLYVVLEGSTKESYCFKRDGQTIKVNSNILKGTRGVSTKTRSNALYLSTAAQFNVNVAMRVKEWFRVHFNILSGLDDDTLAYTAKTFIDNSMVREQILNMIGIVDNCIKDMSIKENVKETRLPVNANQLIEHHKLDIQSTHDLYKNGTVIGKKQLDFRLESLGTAKLFALLGPFFDTIQNGGVLIIDEFGASLHTQLSMELLRLFYSPINILGAQLIIATHDTNLLRKDLLRRDQIWFAEKNSTGVSDLYSLVEYKVNQANSVRNDASFSKDYLLGRYGAIPYFGNLEKFVLEYGGKK